MKSKIIPTQQTGSSFDVCEQLTSATAQEAGQRYLAARDHLLDINHWGVFAGEAPDTFILTDGLGNPIERIPKVGDHIKIHLPGPRSTISDGADWVRIEKISERKVAERFTALTVRPRSHPRLAAKTVAHFYDDHSTNTFIVHLRGLKIVASIHGRNEITNTDTNWLEVIRNLLVALPAKAGLSDPHWQKLAKGLIEN